MNIIPQSEAPKFLHKLMLLAQEDVKAQQGVNRNSVGQYINVTELNKLIAPETKSAQKIFSRSVKAFTR